MLSAFRSFLSCLTALPILGLLLPGQAQALDVRTVHGPGGQAVFELRFHEPHEIPDLDWPATWSLSDGQKDRITEVIGRWAEILRPQPGGRTGIVHIYTSDVRTAYAVNRSIETDGETTSALRAALLGLPDPQYRPDGYDVEIVFGSLPMDDGQHGPSQHSATLTGFGLEGIAFHELAHGLGIASDVELRTDPDGDPIPERPYFSQSDSPWNRHLRDDHGRPAQPGQAILCAACANEPEPGAFDVRKDQGYFTGPHVNEVLAGALPGVPVRMLYGDGSLDGNNMSHLELDNSLISHQYFRSYTTFLEAELAVLQDLGYDIDRRRLYGRSIYGSGLTLDNHGGFHDRNAAGTAYLPGSYSTATLGMGLHVYGSHNRIIQHADLLTRGAGAVGIRVDGEGNRLTLPAGVRVHGQGANGAGVLFAYGRHHTLAHQGDIQGAGPGGVGILADFGNNAYSNERMVRGSYLFCDGADEPCAAPWQSNRPLLPELDGALVSRLDISGTVGGERAAIAASDNALIDHIDILRGARIEGDIRSDYRQVDEQGRLRLTRLTLGRAAGADGLATEAPDPDFRFVYQYDIHGDNLSLRIAGGEAVLHGEHQLHDARIDRDASLSGPGRYRITGPGQALVNDGRLAPGASLGEIRVAGDYRQGSSGALEIEFDGAGAHDRLLVNGTASLRGELALRALPDWYASGWRLDLDDTLQAGHTQGGFERTTVALDSPTLQASLESAGSDGPTATLRISRAANAYSRYGETAAAASAGTALDRAAASAPPEQQGLYQALDFSAADGGGIAALTTQLAPTPYVAMAASQLDALRVAGDGLARQQMLAADHEAGDGWRGFILPFASQARRELDDGSRFRHHSQGLLLGTEHQLGDSAWTAGVHAAFSEQRLTLRSPLRGQGRNSTWLAGLHTRYVPDPRQGLFLQGQLNLASVRARLDRGIEGAGYAASHSARWRSHGLHAQAIAGYQWTWSGALSGGPVAGLDYLWLRQPGFQETGDPATSLSLHSTHPQSLRASLGWRLAWRTADSAVAGAEATPASTGAPSTAAAARLEGWQAHLQLTRDQELMRHRPGQSAGFAVQPGIGLQANQALAGSGAWRLQLGLSHQTPRLQLSAYLEGQSASRGQHQVAGQISASWRF